MSNLKNELCALAGEVSAADLAELFMSPYSHKNLLLLATEEEGPAMWMVNRSDIYTPVLSHLAEHSIKGIASRAHEKLNLRKNPPVDLPTPLAPEKIDFEGVHNHEIEEILGHPQVEARLILEISHSPNADHRASAALSLCRRLLEFPYSEEEFQKVISRFSDMLVNDTSDYVRSYSSRVPNLSTDTVIQALKVESNPQVQARLLQHPSLPIEEIERNLMNLEALTPFSQTVVSIDKRLSAATRNQLLKEDATPVMAAKFHEFILSES